VEFAYVVKPAFDQSFLASATEEQRAVLERHGEWLEARYSEGRIVFAGRCYEGPFGLVVFHADGEEHARAFVAEDPSVSAGVQTAELYPFRTFLARERRP
jgi:uncharacterized protein